MSYSNFMAVSKRDSCSESLRSFRSEDDWKVLMLAIITCTVSLRDAEAGRRSPECHCRTWWALWLNKRVCAARFITVFIFFPPMPAPYHSFKIGGPKEVACWQQCHTMTISPETLNLTSSHLARFLDQTTGLPCAHRQPLCGTGWKSRPGFKCAAWISPSKVNRFFLKSKLRCEVLYSISFEFGISCLFLFRASLCYSQVYVSLVATSTVMERMGMLECHDALYSPKSHPQSGWDSLRTLHDAGGLALQQRWFLADGSEEPDDEKKLFCDFLWLAQCFHWWKRCCTSVDDV